MRPAHSVLALFFLCACGGAGAAPDETSTASASPIGAAAPRSGIGAACVFAIEDDPTFAGFDVKEVFLETQAGYASGDPMCLANHFQGRVSCPYGQGADGAGPAGEAGCETPGGAPVTPSFGGGVVAQCADRTARDTVYTSCRCANAAGRTDDGGRYCTCPEDFACADLVSWAGPEDPSVALAGAYCMKRGTAYDAATACTSACAPGVAGCP